MPPDPAALARIRAHPAFEDLARTRRALTRNLSLGVLSLYAAFVAVKSFWPGFITTPLYGSLTWGMGFTLLLIACVIASTAFYVYAMNRSVDARIREITRGSEG